MPEVPGAVADVELRVVEIVQPEARAAGVEGDPFRGGRLELHQADRTRRRASARLKLALLIDDGSEQLRPETVVARMRPDDRLVVQRVTKPLEPVGRFVLDVQRDSDDGRDEDSKPDEPPTHATRAPSS